MLKKISIFNIFIFFFFSVGQCSEKSTVLNDFDKMGFHEFKCPEFSTEFYNEIYRLFDEFVESVTSNIDLLEALKKAEQEFTAKSQLYGTCPIGLIDQSKSKKHDRIYFHFSKEFYTYLLTLSREILNIPSFLELLKKLNRVQAISNAHFQHYITHISQHHPSLRAAFSSYESLPIIIKVVKYNSTREKEDMPHYDYSALTLLMDNTDQEEESLFISKYEKPLHWLSFMRPTRHFQNNSILLMPGIALHLLGIDCPPTPHVVRYIKKDRYALIAFCMVPHLEVRTEQIRISDVR